MQLCYDNNSAMTIAHDQVQHYRTKNIGIDKHFINKDNLDRGMMVTTHVPIRLDCS